MYVYRCIYVYVYTYIYIHKFFHMYTYLCHWLVYTSFFSVTEYLQANGGTVSCENIQVWMRGYSISLRNGFGTNPTGTFFGRGEALLGE